ncbi:sensor histidine kinase [Leptospira koniambonensis]|uniref:sensor histidine kinase n=1 Tax=Leptospira koniambonensis TaxID=2484950 RepID=UPI003EB99300
MNDSKFENITKIPFKVSSRTARLIGRENIATSKGAIIELVKNAYDADSKISIVFFDNKYSTFSDSISQEHYNELIKNKINKELLEMVYLLRDGLYVAKNDLREDNLAALKKALLKLSVLYIIDSGEGMTQNVIRDHWMTIGTDNKSINVFTKNRRVKAGAKGIGRFALDKLGAKCEMITIFNSDYHKPDTDQTGRQTKNVGYRWKVNWEDFEGDFKTIDSVNAELVGIPNTTIKQEIIREIPTFDFSKINSETNFQYGTILKISDLRDNWEDYYIQQVYSDLEVLVPPKETGGFEIHLYSSLTPNKYGEVLSSVCDDFDYKLIATADENQNVIIRIERNEYDLELIPKEFFERDALKQAPYKKKNFKDGFWQKTVTFSQLLKGFKDIDEDNEFSNIGVFSFTFYFLKRAYSTPDADRFFYRKFMSNERKDWLDKFGGIKLFRDNFRVRPYGEARDAAFDWLGLGNRKSTSPAGVAKREGGYRVEPENVAGAIKISRLTNVNFEDKSSREGLQDNKTFQIFKQLLASIINVFEEDRSYIAREMADFDNLRYGPERDMKAAEDLAKRILETSRAKKKDKEFSKKTRYSDKETDNYQDREKEILASKIESQEEVIEKLKEEQKVLRGLASSGIVLASFSHDLSKLNDVLSSRIDKLRNLLSSKLTESAYENVEERKNPFFQLEKIKKQDLKIQNWLNFSLGATRKDKRRRKQLFLKKYFSDLSSDWNTVLENRGIKLDVSNIEDLDLRVYEIDFDSIFNNLLVNSIDAFTILKANRGRLIKITALSTRKDVIIEYSDNGPGISKDIIEPNKIFEPLFTTKRNPFTGEEEGTGLGMWLVKSIVSENDGVVKILFPNYGFGIRIIFPVKFKR